MVKRQIPCLFDDGMVLEIEELRALETQLRPSGSTPAKMAEIIREAVGHGLSHVRRRLEYAQSELYDRERAERRARIEKATRPSVGSVEH